jgi:hypothetical protein
MTFRKRAIGIGFLAIFLTAFATDGVLAKRWYDNPNSGYCKSGYKAANLKNCKENGGKR